MKYFIKRDLNEYGPYTLADLQRYVAQGNIVMTDLARGEGMTDWVPVSQILAGAQPAPPPAQPVIPAAPAAYPAQAAYPATAAQPTAMQPAIAQPGGYPVAVGQVVPGPMPPDFHWALVLVISFFCSIFVYVWLFIEAGFVRKIRPQSSFLGFLIAGIVCMYGGLIAFYIAIIAAVAASSGGSGDPTAIIVMGIFFGLVEVVAFVLYLIGIFRMRDAFQEYYNTVEPISLRLSGVMTFFFAPYYFQYHFTRIAQWKKTGVLQPQG